MSFVNFRGVHLKDLILLHTALPDRVEGNLINFRKMAQLSLILRELTKLQGHDSIPGVYANMDLINTLRVKYYVFIKVPIAPNYKGVYLQNTSKSHSYHLKIWHLL